MGNSYEYTGINTSATVTFLAGADMADIGATAVTLSEEGLSRSEERRVGKECG